MSKNVDEEPLVFRLSQVAEELEAMMVTCDDMVALFLWWQGELLWIYEPAGEA